MPDAAHSLTSLKETSLGIGNRPSIEVITVKIEFTPELPSFQFGEFRGRSGKSGIPKSLLSQTPLL
jgi:hypothetical protein